MFEQFDESARRALVVATARARERRRTVVGTEDVLVALGSDETTTVGRCLHLLGAGASALTACLPIGAAEVRGHLPFSSHALELFRAAGKLAREPDELISDLHLLTELTRNPDCGGYRCLETMGVDVFWVQGLRNENGLLDVAALERSWRQERLAW